MYSCCRAALHKEQAPHSFRNKRVSFARGTSEINASLQTQQQGVQEQRGGLSGLDEFGQKRASACPNDLFLHHCKSIVLPALDTAAPHFKMFLSSFFTRNRVLRTTTIELTRIVVKVEQIHTLNLRPRNGELYSERLSVVRHGRSVEAQCNVKNNRFKKLKVDSYKDAQHMRIHRMTSCVKTR